MHRWSQSYSEGGEICEYLNKFATKFGLKRRIKFGQEIIKATWDEEAKVWTVETKQGDAYKANVYISALGPLHVPNIPKFKVRLTWVTMSNILQKCPPLLRKGVEQFYQMPICH